MTDQRFYFVMGDMAANVVAGSLAALGLAAVVGPNWNMLAVAVAAMAGGMFIGLLIGLAFLPWFGTFEILLPVMTTSMCAAMAGGMISALDVLSLTGTTTAGGMIGLVVLATVSLLDSRIRGQETSWTP